MKQFRALEEFRKISDRMGKGGMNFCLCCGCLVKDISLRFAVYLVNACKKEAFREW